MQVWGPGQATHKLFNRPLLTALLAIDELTDDLLLGALNIPWGKELEALLLTETRVSSSHIICQIMNIKKFLKIHSKLAAL